METLPNAIRSAIQSVAGFLRAVGQFFIGIGRWFKDVFKSIADGIKSFLKPVVDFFSGISQAIRNVVNKIWNLVLSVIDRIPDALLPSSLEKLKRRSVSQSLSKAANVAVRSINPSKPASAATPSAIPAATEAGARTQSLDRLEATLRASTTGRSSAPGGRQPIILKLQVDGETIARASHNAGQDTADRTYSSVPAY